MADDVIAAPGADPDSRRRELKQRLAMAETRGDTDTVAQLRDALDALGTPEAEVLTDKPEGRRDRAQAAASRREAAGKSTKDDADATSTPPAGRSPAPKDTTAAATDPGTGATK